MSLKNQKIRKKLKQEKLANKKGSN
jgi:hypothetical protein